LHRGLRDNDDLGRRIVVDDRHGYTVTVTCGSTTTWPQNRVTPPTSWMSRTYVPSGISADSASVIVNSNNVTTSMPLEVATTSRAPISWEVGSRFLRIWHW